MTIKCYECKVCGHGCIGFPSNGEIYEKEICDEECLEKLNDKKEDKEIEDE